MIDGLDDIENFGIDLKLDSHAAESFYCSVLRSWFEEIKGYRTVPVGQTEFTLTLDGEQVATVYIEHSVLRMKPLQMDAYEILICILEFIADNHKKTINAYDYLDEEGENTPSEYEESYRPLGKELHDIVKDYMDKEESDDDSDDEWI